MTPAIRITCVVGGALALVSLIATHIAIFTGSDTAANLALLYGCLSFLALSAAAIGGAS